MVRMISSGIPSFARSGSIRYELSERSILFRLILYDFIRDSSLPIWRGKRSKKTEVRRRAEEIGSPVNKKKFGVYTKQCRGSATELHEGNSTIESISIRHEKKPNCIRCTKRFPACRVAFCFSKPGEIVQ